MTLYQLELLFGCELKVKNSGYKHDELKLLNIINIECDPLILNMPNMNSDSSLSDIHMIMCVSIAEQGPESLAVQFS